MKFQVYEQEGGTLLTTKYNARRLKSSGIICDDQLLYEFDVATFEEAKAIYNLRSGFKPDDMGKTGICSCGSIYYPEGSGVCWKCGKVH